MAIRMDGQGRVSITTALLLGILGVFTCIPSCQGDACQFGSCKYGGVCTADPNTPLGWRCVCMDGYTGTFCEIAPELSDPCENVVCQNEGTCTSASNAEGYQCDCIEGYTGTLCESEVDPCDALPCQNGGQCNMAANVNGYTCTCTEEYTGVNCEIEINPCDDVVCENGGQCTVASSEDAGYQCNCMQGYTGDHCETGPNPCDSEPCLNGGECTSDTTVGSFQCECPEGYLGDLCQFSDLVNPCGDVTCQNGGACVVSSSNMEGYLCDCPSTFTGQLCETEITPGECEGIICMNGGTCLEEDGICQCTQGWTGARCNETAEVTTFFRLVVTLEGDVGNEVISTAVDMIKQQICPGNACKNYNYTGKSPGSTNLHFEVSFNSSDNGNQIMERIYLLDEQNFDSFNVIEEPIVSFGTGTLVARVRPNQGPTAGGTRITAIGFDLPMGDDMEVRLGDLPCRSHRREPTYLECETPALEDDSLLNEALRVYLVNTSTGSKQHFGGNFTYRTNPEVTTNQTYDTILRGGIEISIPGQRLQIVGRSQLNLTVNQGGEDLSFSQECRVKNESTLLCLTPKITLDMNTNKTSSTKTGQVEGITCMTVLHLDSLSFPLGNFTLYYNPVIHAYTKSVYFRPYAPINDKEIEITGVGLLHGVKETDYRVTVGGTECKNRQVTDTNIVCEPEIIGGKQLVEVYIGGNPAPIKIGTISIAASIWDHAPSKYGIVSFIIIASAILICAFIFCYCQNNCSLWDKMSRNRVTKRKKNGRNFRASIKFYGERISDAFRATRKSLFNKRLHKEHKDITTMMGGEPIVRAMIGTPGYLRKGGMGGTFERCESIESNGTYASISNIHFFDITEGVMPGDAAPEQEEPELPPRCPHMPDGRKCEKCNKKRTNSEGNDGSRVGEASTSSIQIHGNNEPVVVHVHGDNTQSAHQTETNDITIIDDNGRPIIHSDDSAIHSIGSMDNSDMYIQMEGNTSKPTMNNTVESDSTGMPAYSSHISYR